MTWSPDDEATPELVNVYLKPGTLYCAAEASRVTTILGSCVAVCLWDTKLRVGGINHYLLPHWRGRGARPRFGDTAIEKLLEGMLRLGCQPETLRAKVFGGAAVLGFATGGDPVGDQNVRVALETLRQHDIPIIARRTGGVSGMWIRMLTESGEVTARCIATAAIEPVRRDLPDRVMQRA